MCLIEKVEKLFCNVGRPVFAQAAACANLAAAPLQKAVGPTLHKVPLRVHEFQQLTDANETSHTEFLRNLTDIIQKRTCWPHCMTVYFKAPFLAFLFHDLKTLKLFLIYRANN